MSRPLHIIVGATTAPWSAAFRSYVRDHAQGARVEVVMDRAALSRSLKQASVLIIDDIMRTFSSLDIFRAQHAGVVVIGVAEQAGAGRKYLAELGADRVVASSVTAADLLALAMEASEASGLPATREVPATAAQSDEPTSFGPRGRTKQQGVLAVWTKVSGGAGLTEAVVVAAEQLAQRVSVLLIEAEELSPVLLSRLSRSPEGGLPLALSRKAQGLPALPEALSAPRQGHPRTGSFDVVCAAANPVQPLNPSQLGNFVSEAMSYYDCVLVETGWLVGAASGRERFSAARSLLQRADSVVVLAGCDPEGAARLVQWRAMAVGHAVLAPTWAAFGRARPNRYEQSHLQSIVECNTGKHPFAGMAFLPEDGSVARARWNGELIWKGPFKKAASDLATASVLALASSRPRRWGAARTLSASAKVTTGATAGQHLAVYERSVN